MVVRFHDAHCQPPKPETDVATAWRGTLDSNMNRYRVSGVFCRKFKPKPRHSILADHPSVAQLVGALHDCGIGSDNVICTAS